MDRDDSKLRVFISYSHEDRETVDTIAQVLQHNGLRPMYDKAFSGGTQFHDAIKEYIDCADVFLPVITKASNQRVWLHQEIGYAVARNLPILPMVIGDELPTGMIQQLLAVVVDERLAGLEQQLTERALGDLVKRNQYTASAALFECAHYPEGRAEMVAKYSRDLAAIGMIGRVRQKGALSSFAVPSQDITHEVWNKQYGHIPGSMLLRERLREERRCLDEHAKVAGCRLIIDPTLEYSAYGPESRRSRLQSLISFLEADEVAELQVAFDSRMSRQENVLIVGSYFYSEAVLGGLEYGYFRTIFTRHSPTLATRTEEFDGKFAELLNDAGWTVQDSRWRAAQHLREIIATL